MSGVIFEGVGIYSKKVICEIPAALLFDGLLGEKVSIEERLSWRYRKIEVLVSGGDIFVYRYFQRPE